jgi:glycosyltransferase involved in cell wall biosynthesis
MSPASSEPLVSIGIPTYNRRQYAIRAVNSVLSQTYANIEVVVSDNASTDDTIKHLSTIQDHGCPVKSRIESVGWKSPVTPLEM